MKKSLWKKICAAGIVLSSSFILLNVLLTYLFMAPFSTIFYRDQMEDIAADLITKVADDEDSFEEYMEQLDENHNVKITVIDNDKNVLSTTRVTDIKKGKFWPNIVNAIDSQSKKLESGKSIFLSRNRQRGEHKVVSVIMIQKIAENRFVIISRSYQSLINATYAAMVFELVIGVPLLIVVMLIIYHISRRLVRPLKDMTETAAHISMLEFDNKVNVTTEDEVGQLGNAINKMSEHLENNVAMLQKDIEDRKKLVRNLSHEIKSPMAVIMGYADRLKTVLSKNPEKALEYCEIISNESTRVDVLVKEMLDLSKLDQSADELNKEQFPVKRLFENISRRFKEENMEKAIRYSDRFNEDDFIRADYIMLERAVYNLVNNAVQHGLSENMDIVVTGKKNDQYYEIRVFNSGSTIDESEISDVWNAFSKVDKARTRGKGYGIGLAIVREIVEAHQGYYSVENKENGVEFCISICNETGSNNQ